MKILVYANKQDLPTAISPTELTHKLNLHALRGRDVRKGRSQDGAEPERGGARSGRSRKRGGARPPRPRPLQWYVQSSNARTADGLLEGLEWLEGQLR